MRRIILIIKINEIERDVHNPELIYGRTYFKFSTKFLGVNWFNDCGEWFLYFQLMNYYIRFSGAGFLKGKMEESL